MTDKEAREEIEAIKQCDAAVIDGGEVIFFNDGDGEHMIAVRTAIEILLSILNIKLETI